MALRVRPITNHSCYILRSIPTGRAYIGYTVDLPHRIRQHNGELVGGAKKTTRGRPWALICHIRGFPDAHTALQFEWRVQHIRRFRARRGVHPVTFALGNLKRTLDMEGWPWLLIRWADPRLAFFHSRVITQY